MGPEHAPIGGRGETSHWPAISLVGLHPGQKMAAGRTLATQTTAQCEHFSGPSLLSFAPIGGGGAARRLDKM